MASGCSTTGGDVASVLDPSLPDVVSVTPSFAGDTRGAAGSTSGENIGFTEAAYAPSSGSTGARADVERLIAKYAAVYEVPVDLVRHVAWRESTFNANAYNNGHWGLMQIKHATARGMGYRGPARGLLDAETNLKYAVKYLRGAWLVSEGNAKLADRLYQRGYYYDAKRKGLLDETGLGKDRKRRRMG